MSKAAELSTRAKAALAQRQADASQSGMVPLLGMGALAFIIGALIRLIF